MRCLRGTRNKIKHSLRIRHIRNRINLKRMNHIWELHRITNKENFKLFPTKSQLPSSVYIFTAKPRGSLAVSGESLAPATVENEPLTVFLPAHEYIFLPAHLQLFHTFQNTQMLQLLAHVLHVLEPLLDQNEKFFDEMIIFKCCWTTIPNCSDILIILHRVPCRVVNVSRFTSCSSREFMSWFSSIIENLLKIIHL